MATKAPTPTTEDALQALIRRIARLEARVQELETLAEGPPWDDDETLTGFPDDSDGRY